MIRLDIAAIVVMLAFTTVAHAGERKPIADLFGKGTKIERNKFLDDRYIVRDKRGNRIGTIEPNRFLKDRYDVRDKRGRRIGTVERR